MSRKFLIKSTVTELDSIGIPYDITGLTGEFVKRFPDGWIVLNVTHSHGGRKFTNDFDLPVYMCDEIIN